MFAITETFWLSLTNFGLAALCAICCVAVTVDVVRSIADRRKRKLATLLRLEDAPFAAGDLGWTMADGGEWVDRRHQAHTTASDAGAAAPKNS